MSAVRFQFRGAKLARFVVTGGLRELGSTDLVLSAVRFLFCEAKLARFVVSGGLGEIGSTDLVLSAVRFLFRETKLARVVVLRRTEGIWFYRFSFVGSPLPLSRGETG